MNSKDIFYALQTGKISPEDAEKEIIEMMGQVAKQSSNVHTAELSGEQQLSLSSRLEIQPMADLHGAEKKWPQFPELIHLNNSFQGRPVFWFHGGVGTVSGYRVIARKIQRPFYGIQPRGWVGNRAPLNGIQAMAAYYSHIILSVQPKGPYDLGGYSLGGRLAYEVTRQLQELGETVNTIVMVDSVFLDSPYQAESPKFVQKTLLLQAVNMQLLSKIVQEPKNIAQTFIHQSEVNVDIDDEEFLKQLIILAKARGLNQTEQQLCAQIQQRVRVQRAYGIEQFSVLPLPDPQAVRCYYLRNKSGLFYGELEPYFRVGGKQKIELDHTRYWGKLENEIPNFYMMDVDSSNHMTLLSEPRAYGAVSALCEKVYS